MDVARQGVRLAREAISEAGREGEVAVAFSLNGDLDAPDGAETIRLLAPGVGDRPAGPHPAGDAVARARLDVRRPSPRLLETGLPVWLSFRRCRRGVCGIYGEHWGGPEGDAFGRAARRFEQQGVGALHHQLHAA